MKRFAISILSIFIMLESISLYAWGPMGHDVVAAIAENNLTKKAKKNLAGLEGKLNNESFVSRAPEAVVNAEREKAAKAKDLIAQLEESKAALMKL